MSTLRTLLFATVTLAGCAALAPASVARTVRHPVVHRALPARLAKAAPVHLRRSLLTDAVARRPAGSAHSALAATHRTISASHRIAASPMG